MSAEPICSSFARRAASLALLSVALAAIALTAPVLRRDAAAQTPVRMNVEAENYILPPYDNGGQPISLMLGDSLASGYTSVWGMDYPGDWIELNVHVPYSMFVRDSVRSCGDTGIRRRWVVQWELSAPWTSVIDTLPMTPAGAGIT